tara:strand:+ start:495 stop:1586 length:1092 start_codon:yes stop_codon:yes gene_type:complete
MMLPSGPSSVECMLCMQIAMLLVLERAISQIHSQLKQKSAAAPVGTATAAKALASPGSRPTIDGLGEEVINPDFAASKEWALLKPDELQVVRRLKAWLGNAAFSKLPRDLLVCFVRGYAYRADWAEASFAYLDQCLRWRDGMSADVIALQSELLPPKRAMFEAIVQAGPIGFDREGHPVILDRVGATDPSKLLPNFDQDAFMRQQCYNRECLRVFATANCLRRKKRLYKMVQVIDLKGLGWAHTDSQMYALLKHYNSVFSWNYPESLSKIIVINAPFVFQAVWKMIQPWIHPITRQKIDINGRSYQAVFAKNGITLFDGATEARHATPRHATPRTPPTTARRPPRRPCVTRCGTCAAAMPSRH